MVDRHACRSMLPSECLSPLRVVEGCLITVCVRCRGVEASGASDRRPVIARWRTMATHRATHLIPLLATLLLLAPRLLTPAIPRWAGGTSPRHITETA